ncbi:MAG: glycoside hydrolase family 25 protein [Lewinellaceae bacterium]|nr:glycoside hydrolase family 25 protein [Lewinellaceae bacterium]
MLPHAATETVLSPLYFLRMRLFTLFLFIFSPLWSGYNASSRQYSTMELQGVDVSHYQKQIEWDTVVYKHALDFAFVKATEGHDYRDSMFCSNWTSLRRLGVRRGAYHFFRAYGCGYEQAINFLKTVDMKPGDIAPVLDIERTDGIPEEIMREEAHIWLQLVESHLGIKPIIYTNQFFYERYLAGHFEQYPLWIARYSDERPFLTTGKRWDIWQHSNEGCLDGISEKVDLNIFPGNTDMLDKLCWFPASVNAETETAP